WNTQVNEDPSHGAEDNERQAYAGLVLNAGLGERVALGVVPVYLHNPNIFDFESDDGFSVGVNGQVYFTDSFSFLGEWIVSEERPGLEKDSGTFGFELETRGHFFKLVITNQAR